MHTTALTVIVWYTLSIASTYLARRIRAAMATVAVSAAALAVDEVLVVLLQEVVSAAAVDDSKKKYNYFIFYGFLIKSYLLSGHKLKRK